MLGITLGLLIEPVWNGNLRCTAGFYVTRPSQTFNRTSLEWKQRTRLVLSMLSELKLLIEPVWNGNRGKIKRARQPSRH